MVQRGRRRFLEGMAVSAALGGGTASAQAPAKTGLDDSAPDRKALAAALRTLNAAAGLGVAADDVDRAEAYATGAILEAAKRLRPLVLEAGVEPSVVFRARRAR